MRGEDRATRIIDGDALVTQRNDGHDRLAGGARLNGLLDRAVAPTASRAGRACDRDQCGQTCNSKMQRPQPRPLQRRILASRLQWALEGPGWSVLRPALDFVLMCTAVTVGMGGVGGVLHPDALRAPLLAMPPLVMIGPR